MRSIETLPYLTADEGCLVGGPWQRVVGGDAVDLGNDLPDWDSTETLVVRRIVQLDAAAARASAGLPPDCPLTLGVRWRSPAGRAQGRGALVQVSDERLDAVLTAELPGSELCDLVELTTLVVLSRSLQPVPIRAWRAGTVIWSDEWTVNLGGAAHFPMQSVPFAGWAWPAGAIWRLDWNPEELDAPVLGSLCVYLNSDHPLHTRLIGRATSSEASMLRMAIEHGVAVALIRGALSQPGFSEDSVWPPRSVGRVIQRLLNSRLRTLGYQHLREEMRQQPEVFEARLQDGLRLFGEAF